MEFENDSSVLSSPPLSDLDDFYSAPSSPVISESGSDASNSPSQRFKSTTSSSSFLSPIIPPVTLPQAAGQQELWEPSHEIDLDSSLFGDTSHTVINNLRMTFVFHVDESLPFTTNQIWSPFREASHITMNNLAIGNMVFYDTDPEYSDPTPPVSQGVGVANSLTGISHAIFNDINIVCTANNSGKYEQTKIVAPFYDSSHLILNNPVIQLITVIKDGGRRHRCPPEKISARKIIWSPFFQASHFVLNTASLLLTEGTETLFSCPCLLSSIACSSFVSSTHVSLTNTSLSEIKKKPKGPEKHTRLFKLLQCSLTGVELNSVLRWPYPRCYGMTRSFLRQKIITWLVDDNRKQDALWLYGDAGSGKSAVAQTVGEYADERGILGATTFISRSKKLNDAAQIIPSISFQLSQCNKAYEHIVTKVIQENPSILNINTSMRTQFKELVLKPFSVLEKESPGQKKTLIIIDGLDEIDGKMAQSDLIDVIGEILHPSYISPFIWLLCSRPELHLHDAFRRYETRILYQAIATSSDADDAHKDVESFYLEELHRLKQENSGCFASDTGRLGETANFLNHVRSHSFLYASTLVRFIAGPGVSNPASRLEAVLELVERPRENYTAIDTLYLHILETIPRESESGALHLLGALTVSTLIPALYLAAMLGISKDDFYSILEPLRPVLLVPWQHAYETESLRFYHVSFPDFLINPDYSGRFFQDPNLSRVQLAEAQFRAMASPVILHSRTSQLHPLHPVLGFTAVRMPYHDILIHAAKTTWDICSQISHPSHQWLRDTLLNFDFQSLQDISETIPTYSFMRFLWWLQESVQDIHELQDIVRTSPKSSIDTRFIGACEQYPSHSYRRRQSIASPFPLSRGDADEILKEPCFALAGFGVQTVLVLLTPETVMIFSEEDIDDL